MASVTITPIVNARGEPVSSSGNSASAHTTASPQEIMMTRRRPIRSEYRAETTIVNPKTTAEAIPTVSTDRKSVV